MVRKQAMASAATFGNLLRQLRRRAGMTQGELAAAVGFSVSQISRLEKDERLPNLDLVVDQFLPILRLEEEPRLAEQLLTLAAEARGEERPDLPRTNGTIETSAREANAYLPSALPPLPLPLVGRDDDIAAIGERLLAAPGRLLTLIGPPGIGKTQLAIAAGNKIRHLFADDAHIISLVNLSVAGQLAATILSTLGEVPSAKKDPEQQVIAWLRHKKILLILDNFEQITEAARMVATLLAECPTLYVLVTSQQPLRLRAEQRYPVAPLTDVAAVELFIQRAQAIDPTFPTANTQHDTIRTICLRLDCLPLAIELITPEIELFSPPQILARLQDQQLDLLVNGPRDLPTHQQTLRNALHRSYSLLEQAEQNFLCILGLFAGGCTVDTLHNFLATEGNLIDPSLLHECSNLLKRLIRKSLVQQQATRITLLKTVRDYALEQLAENPNFSRLAAHHATFFLQLARNTTSSMQNAPLKPWLDQLSAEHDNLRAALNWAITAASPIALDLVIALADFWSIRGHDYEARTWIKQALTTQSEPTQTRAAVLCLSATFARRQADYAEAQRDIAEALAIYRTTTDETTSATAGLATTLRQAGWLAYDLHDIPATVDHFEASLQILRQCDLKRELAETLLALVHVYIHRTEHTATVQAYLAESLAIYRDLNDREGIAHVLQQQGELDVTVGNYVTAITRFREALTIWRAVGAKLHIAWGLALLGEAAWLQRDLATAATYFDEAYQHFVEVGNKDGCAILLHHKGQVARCRDMLADATMWYCESMWLSFDLQNRHMLARCSAGLAAVALAAQEIERAIVLLGAAQQLFDQLPPFLAPADEDEYQGFLAQAKAQSALRWDEWSQCWQQGQSFTLAALVHFAADLTVDPSMVSSPFS